MHANGDTKLFEELFANIFIMNIELYKKRKNGELKNVYRNYFSTDVVENVLYTRVSYKNYVNLILHNFGSERYESLKGERKNYLQDGICNLMY